MQNVIQHVIVTLLQLCQRTVGMAGGAVIRELFVLGKGVSHLNEEAAWPKKTFLMGGAGESRGIY